MRKVIITAAVLLPTIMFAQVDGSAYISFNDRDTLSYQIIDLKILRNDLLDIYVWQTEDINNGKYVCEYSRELLRATIEDLNAKLCESTRD